MGEFDLLRHVYTRNDALPAAAFIPPGDDMGALRLGGKSILAAVDQLIDGRHVVLERVGLAAAGRKAIARSVSDIAAMAAYPRAALVAVCLPEESSDADARTLFDGMAEAGRAFGTPLIGGDIARGPGPLSCSVTVLAEPGPAGIITRRGAQAGDGVYVTGELGGSLRPDGTGHHLSFTPRVDAALELALTLGDRLHAMIDLSDGLGRDAGHLADGAGACITIEATAVPRRGDVDLEAAIGDGEDYELLFTAAGEVPETVSDGCGGIIPVTRIGTVAAGPTGVRLHVAGDLRDVSEAGFSH